MLALARQADVLIENFKVGGLAKYGLDYASVAAANPGLVYASITGFGQQGPYAERAGYDFIIQGMSGFMSVTGERDDLPGGGPQKAGVAITDILTGMYASVAILAALSARDRSGQGQHVDCALLDSAVAMMSSMNMNFLTSGQLPGRAGNAHQNIVPYQVFECADGHLILAVGNDGQFVKFCAVAGMPAWATDARFAKNADRVRHREDAGADDRRRRCARARSATGLTRSKPRRCLAARSTNSTRCSPIRRCVARGLRFDLPHPLAGTVPLVGPPVKMSGTPLTPTRPPPLLGEHTAAVLRERLQLSDARIAGLAADGVIGLRP